MNSSRSQWVVATVFASACIAASAFVMSSLALAEDGEPSAVTQPEAESLKQAETKSAAHQAAAPAAGKKKAKGGKGTREKDADGSEAPDRFQADTVIKSQYKLNGQPLEVDPD